MESAADHSDVLTVWCARMEMTELYSMKEGIHGTVWRSTVLISLWHRCRVCAGGGLVAGDWDGGWFSRTRQQSIDEPCQEYSKFAIFSWGAKYWATTTSFRLCAAIEIFRVHEAFFYGEPDFLLDYNVQWYENTLTWCGGYLALNLSSDVHCNPHFHMLISKVIVRLL